MTVVNTSSAIIASRSTGGDPSDNTCDYGSMSADGRYVVFASAASNFIPGDVNNDYDAFIFDSVTGITKLVSRSITGGTGDAASIQHMDVSDDGRYVAFSSQANNLVANDPNMTTFFDVFVRDMQTGATTRIAQGDVVGISGDGRYLVYNSSNDEVAGDTNGRVDVYVRDMFTGQTSVVSKSTAGVVGNDQSSAVGMSQDGRFIAFESYARNLVANDATGNPDVYLRDRLTGTTTLISVNSSEVQANGSFSSNAYVSDNGRYVVFASDATNLVANDVNGQSDIFVRDLVAGSTIRVSVGIGGAQFDQQVSRASISDDGRYVTFSTNASQLPHPDQEVATEIYRVSLFATNQADYLLGSDRGDSINAGGGDDSIYASGGNDTLDGGTGVDTMTGGDGNDLYYVDVNGPGGTGDRVFEGPEGGVDTIAARVSYALTAGTFVETLRTTSNGGTAKINLAGNELANTLIGNNGVNLLAGREGNDVLTGLGGNDVFAFDRALGANNVDRITDFVHNADRIQLDHTIFTKLAVGALPASAFKDLASAAEDANDRVLYNHNTGALYYDADGAGGASAVRFATLVNHPAVLSASDFLIVA